MLTIGELAAYAGVTTRTVRHYHRIGLLPEPERDPSGYRSYGAPAVVELIRIRALAEAGVPLARVKELLAADAEEFAAAVAEVDRGLRAEIRRLQQHRRRIARLAAGDSLALPSEVVAFLDRLRASGASSALLEGERDGWILVAARWPDKVPALIAGKMAQLDDPRTMQLYRLIDELAVAGEEDVLVQVADLLAELMEEAAERGELEWQTQEMDDDSFVALLDSFATTHPFVERLQELLAERGWTGWTRVERAPAPPSR